MGTFLLVCIIGVVACMVIGTVIGALLHALFWIITLPFRIVFKLLFGMGGLLFGVVAAIGAILLLLTPLLPVLLLGLFGWTVFRLGSKKPSAPPPSQPGFWS